MPTNILIVSSGNIWWSCNILCKFSGFCKINTCIIFSNFVYYLFFVVRFYESLRQTEPSQCILYFLGLIMHLDCIFVKWCTVWQGCCFCIFCTIQQRLFTSVWPVQEKAQIKIIRWTDWDISWFYNQELAPFYNTFFIMKCKQRPFVTFWCRLIIGRNSPINLVI